MKTLLKTLSLLSFSFCFLASYSQDMTLARLDSLLDEHANELIREENSNVSTFNYAKAQMMMITDATNNRMRVVLPVVLVWYPVVPLWISVAMHGPNRPEPFDRTDRGDL